MSRKFNSMKVFYCFIYTIGKYWNRHAVNFSLFCLTEPVRQVRSQVVVPPSPKEIVETAKRRNEQRRNEESRQKATRETQDDRT